MRTADRVPDEPIARAIYRVRKCQGLNCKEFSVALGLGITSVTGFETGQFQPGLLTLFRLAASAKPRSPERAVLVAEIRRQVMDGPTMRGVLRDLLAGR